VVLREVAVTEWRACRAREQPVRMRGPHGEPA
jgi:hypothetical protein